MGLFSNSAVDLHRDPIHPAARMGADAFLHESERRQGMPALDPRRLFLEFSKAAEFLACTLAGLAGEIAYHTLILHSGGNAFRGLSIGVLAGIMTVAIGTQSKGPYLDKLLLRDLQLRKLVQTWLHVCSIFLAVSFVLKSSEDFSRGAIILAFFFGLGGLVGVRFLSYRIASKLTSGKGLLRRNIAIVGATQITDQLIETLTSHSDGVSIVGVFTDTLSGSENHCQTEVTGTLDDLINLSGHQCIDEVIVTIPWDRTMRIERIIHQLSVTPIPVKLCPGKIAFQMAGGSFSEIAGVPMLERSRRAIDGWVGASKRVLDVGLAGLLLIALAPLLLTIMAAIKLDTPGPTLFKQKRHGFNHNVFDILKFRSMTTSVDTDDVVHQAQKGDQRVTRVGRFLRRSSLDELPQLFNVLKGEMSLVGPRPHAMTHNWECHDLIENYARRHNVKPGMTGWAQVNGLRGETDTIDKMVQRINHDLYYIDHWSILMDLKILVRTAWVLLKGNRTY